MDWQTALNIITILITAIVVLYIRNVKLEIKNVKTGADGQFLAIDLRLKHIESSIKGLKESGEIQAVRSGEIQANYLKRFDEVKKMITDSKEKTIESLGALDKSISLLNQSVESHIKICESNES